MEPGSSGQGVAEAAEHSYQIHNLETVTEEEEHDTSSSSRATQTANSSGEDGSLLQHQGKSPHEGVLVPLMHGISLSENNSPLTLRRDSEGDMAKPTSLQ
uniref:(northern house mosquito) hypothetical protein n=1 Tax=Culex pipiens TaxID=7175 RepID=A0A8D8GNC6_CULPI